MNMSYRFNNKKTFSYFYINANGNMTNRPIVTASWFDKDGVRYAIPVNSKKPSANISSYMGFNQPLGEDRKFSIGISGNILFNRRVSYQAVRDLAGLDLDTFDYKEFMSTFWGDESGDIFYSGASGFKESNTSTVDWGANVNFKYNVEKLNFQVYLSTSNRVTKYSLDPEANLNTWDNSVSGDLSYWPGKEWELKNKVRYLFYNGYTNGFGDPALNWNFSLSKSFKSFTLSLSVNDILNQTKNLRRTSTDEYTEDVYSNVIGRYFLFGFSFNFGKMNAKKNSRVENAMWNMML